MHANIGKTKGMQRCYSSKCAMLNFVAHRQHGHCLYAQWCILFQGTREERKISPPSIPEQALQYKRAHNSDKIIVYIENGIWGGGGGMKPAYNTTQEVAGNMVFCYRVQCKHLRLLKFSCISIGFHRNGIPLCFCMTFFTKVYDRFIWIHFIVVDISLNIILLLSLESRIRILPVDDIDICCLREHGL